MKNTPILKENLSLVDIIDHLQINEHILCLIPSWERSHFENEPIPADKIRLTEQSDFLLETIAEFSSFQKVNIYYVFRHPEKPTEFTFISDLSSLPAYHSQPTHIDLVRILRFVPEDLTEGIATKFLKAIMDSENWEKHKIDQFITTSKSVQFFTSAFLLKYIEQARKNELDEKLITQLEELGRFKQKIFKSVTGKPTKYKIFFGIEPFLAYVLNNCLIQIKRCKNCSSVIPNTSKKYCESKICKQERAKNRKNKQYQFEKLDKEYIK